MWFKKKKYMKLEELQYLCKEFFKIIHKDKEQKRLKEQHIKEILGIKD